MATSLVRVLPSPVPAAAPAWRAAAGVLLWAGLPLGLFGLVNLGAEALGRYPLFFAPFGLPGWAGALLHLVMLVLLGAAFGLLAGPRANRPARLWLAVLAAGLIGFPFLVAPLPALGLSAFSLLLALIGAAAMIRVAARSRAAALVLAPALLWLGVGALLGLAFTLAWTPPFGLVQSPQPASGA